MVGDKFDLPNGWLNADFMHTGSYSPKLDEFSVYYKSFYGVLSVRTIAAEYLIAMKLRSGRKYKNDLSDVIGILAEHEKKGAPITLEKIDAAVTNLYGGWDVFPKDSKPFIEDALKNGDFENVYTSVKKDEIESKIHSLVSQTQLMNTKGRRDYEKCLSLLNCKPSKAEESLKLLLAENDRLQRMVEQDCLPRRSRAQ